MNGGKTHGSCNFQTRRHCIIDVIVADAFVLCTSRNEWELLEVSGDCIFVEIPNISSTLRFTIERYVVFEPFLLFR